MKSPILSVLLLLICLNTHAQVKTEEKLKIVSSASMISDMVYHIAGDLVEHGLIVPIGGDPHLYEPTPKDAQLVAAADHIFVNGLTFEGWITELIANSGTKARVDTVTKGINAIQSSKYKGSYDPHAWMDVSNGIKYCTNIKNGLIQLDPANKASYEKNYKNYIARLYELDQYILKRVQEVPEAKRVLITSHDAFEYYGKRYGLQLEAIVGISTEAEAQTSDIIRINKAIKSSQVPAIFIESTINPKLMLQIAEDNKVSIGGKLYADSIGDKNSPAPSYYDMLKHNTDVIVEALKGERQLASTGNTDKKGNFGLLVIIIAAISVLGLIYIIFKMNK